MKRLAIVAAAGALVGASMAAASHAAIPNLPPAPVLTESPWNGDWVLSESRNTPPIKAAAAKGYRFHLEPDGRIRWEIPSLHEVVEGRTDGRPMQIVRPGTVGLSLGVVAESPRVLTYKVSRQNEIEAEGRMTLVDQGNAWVDISQPVGRPDLAGAVVYVRPGASAN